MNYEHFVGLFRAAPKNEAKSEPEFLVVIELTVDEQDCVAGGYLKACGGFSCCHGCPNHC
jgi:hypothetical protein